ncbi:MAG: twin-arginine translocase TatA/TatE family subunit [Bacteroidales bacterium]|nr:twin-arginine translocase TatA/TatE family subunit [Bacteroidales bacterium]
MILSQLLFFNMSGGEIVIIILAIVLVFGPKKVPELARNIGKTLNQLRNATEDIKKDIIEEVNKIEEKPKAEEPKKNEHK